MKSELEHETERLYDLWLEDNHPEEWRRRSEAEVARWEYLTELARGYQKPIFDPFVEFQPPKTLIRGVIKELDNQAVALVREQNDPAKKWLAPSLKEAHGRILARLKSLQYRLSNFEKSGSWDLSGDNSRRITPEDKEQARRVPIEGLYNGRLRRSGGRLYGLCPFHNEDTGSFVIYIEQNSYHCYGCGENGDVIAFIQKQQNLNFIEAIKWLLGR